MNKFIERLRYKDAEGDLYEQRVFMLRFKAIDAGPFQVSIQAGESLYSTPRRPGTVLEYTEWEIAVFVGERWIGVETLAPFLPERIIDRFETGFGSPVAAYVPTADVELLIDTLTARGEEILAHDKLRTDAAPKDAAP